MIDKVVLAGFGGQGVMFIGKILAYAGMLDGREICWIPSYGPEMRGGTANCSVILSDEEIHSPVIEQADAGIVLNQPSYDKFLAKIKQGGALAALGLALPLLAALLVLIGLVAQVLLVARHPVEIAERLVHLALARVLLAGARHLEIVEHPVELFHQALRLGHVAARLDGPFLQIGAVAQAVDRLLVRLGLGQPVIDPIEQIGFSLKRTVRALKRGPHHFPPTCARSVATHLKG